MKISVFGGSEPKPGTPAYLEALELGRLIANAGHTAMTGGYMGTMEAVSKGANEAGGHVIGVTCEEIEAWRPIGANPWVIEEVRCKTLRERLQYLTEGCDCAVALPGGAGTLTEIMLIWNQMLINAIPKVPIVLIGAGWRAVLNDTLHAHFSDYIHEDSQKLLTFVDTPAEVLRIIQYPHR
jgi:uncharacterized protein (TIGR00730 family)